MDFHPCLYVYIPGPLSKSISSGAQYVILRSKIGWRKLQICQFGSGKLFFLTIIAQLAVTGKRRSICVTVYKRLINNIWQLLSVFDRPIIMISPSGLLLLVPHLFARMPGVSYLSKPSSKTSWIAKIRRASVKGKAKARFPLMLCIHLAQFYTRRAKTRRWSQKVVTSAAPPPPGAPQSWTKTFLRSRWLSVSHFSGSTVVFRQMHLSTFGLSFCHRGMTPSPAAAETVNEEENFRLHSASHTKIGTWISQGDHRRWPGKNLVG